MTVLALIPARGGSKSVPGKNLRPLGGKPLIAWTIEAARACPGLDRVVVTTDSPEIAAVARDYGAETPFLRPAEFARDDSSGDDPIFHALQWFEEHEGYQPEFVLALQPTSPFRTADDIAAALQLARERNADGITSVTPARQHPHWMKRILEDGRLVDYVERDRACQARQELPSVFALNGAIFLIRRTVLLNDRTWYPERTYAYVMPPERSLDIDTPWDFRLAELLAEAGGG
jgi:CMP-N,N'-diacetyllegionaminic acid synthase